MPRQRLHNFIFVVLIAVVLAATAWSLITREPDLLMRESPEAGEQKQITIPADKSPIEKMIEDGKLSNKKAEYYINTSE